MPVFSKIGSVIKRKEINPYNHIVEDIYLELDNFSLMYNDLHTAYKTVLDFIHMYNKLKTKNHVQEGEEQ